MSVGLAGGFAEGDGRYEQMEALLTEGQIQHLQLSSLKSLSSNPGLSFGVMHLEAPGAWADEANARIILASVWSWTDDSIGHSLHHVAGCSAVDRLAPASTRLCLYLWISIVLLDFGEAPSCLDIDCFKAQILPRRLTLSSQLVFKPTLAVRRVLTVPRSQVPSLAECRLESLWHSTACPPMRGELPVLRWAGHAGPECGEQLGTLCLPLQAQLPSRGRSLSMVRDRACGVDCVGLIEQLGTVM